MPESDAWERHLLLAFGPGEAVAGDYETDIDVIANGATTAVGER